MRLQHCCSLHALTSITVAQSTSRYSSSCLRATTALCRLSGAGKNLVRNDGETPEDTAAGNIAKAQQSSGNAIDSIKCGLFAQPL